MGSGSGKREDNTPLSVDIGQAVGGWLVPREGAFGPDFEIGVAVDRLRWGEKIPGRHVIS